MDTTNLLLRHLAVTTGLEPATSDVTDQRSTLLNYATILNCLVFKVRHLPHIFSGTFALPNAIFNFIKFNSNLYVNSHGGYAPLIKLYGKL